MAALGDSITAGTGALSKNIFKIGEEQRGVSFSAGNVTKNCLGIKFFHICFFDS